MPDAEATFDTTAGPAPVRPRPALLILGTRGLPAAHGGFETFAQHLALHLAARGWRVTVYGQEDGHGPVVEDSWQGVHRVRIPVSRPGPAGTVVFDWRCIADAVQRARREDALCLTLGYNTALFCARLRLAGVRNLINMDGIEWRRAKWGLAARTWFWLNEHAGSRLGNHLIADHPEIARHLARAVSASKISTIAYGAERVPPRDAAPVRALGLVPGRYLTLVARPEPENSVLEAVQGFSMRPRGVQLAVLGRYDDAHPYHRAVRGAASPEVRFIGAVYEPPLLQALRLHGLAYVHGHRVGGTNPSLVEALAAGNAVLAHDNRFNRWVAGNAARYFRSARDIDTQLEALLADGATLHAMRQSALARFEAAFTWPAILQQYEVLLRRWLPAPAARPLRV